MWNAYFGYMNIEYQWAGMRGELGVWKMKTVLLHETMTSEYYFSILFSVKTNVNIHMVPHTATEGKHNAFHQYKEIHVASSMLSVSLFFLACAIQSLLLPSFTRVHCSIKKSAVPSLRKKSFKDLNFMDELQDKLVLNVARVWENGINWSIICNTK